MYKRISGIYMIKCATNGDRYIGSAKSLFSRKSDHWINLRKNKHHNKHLQNVWNKYGEFSFAFEILEFVKDEARLLEREQYWIDKLKPELNKAIKAESGFLGLKHSKDTLDKLSKAQKERLKSPLLIDKLREAAKAQNARQPNGMKGKHLSDEMKQRLREATLNQFSSPEGRKKHSEGLKKWMTQEMRKRISKAKTGKSLSQEHSKKIGKASHRAWEGYSEEEKKLRVEKMAKAVKLAKAKRYKGLISPSGKIYREIYNLAEFCREHGLAVAQINPVANGKRKSHKGWRRLKD